MFTVDKRVQGRLTDSEVRDRRLTSFLGGSRAFYSPMPKPQDLSFTLSLIHWQWGRHGFLSSSALTARACREYLVADHVPVSIVPSQSDVIERPYDRCCSVMGEATAK
jgi:hypothetical protein